MGNQFVPPSIDSAIAVPISPAIQNWAIGASRCLIKSGHAHAMPASVYVSSLEGQLFFFGFGLLVILFAMSAAVRWAGVSTGVPGKSKLFFSGFGLLVILFALSAAVRWAGVSAGIPWKSKLYFLNQEQIKWPN